MYVMLDALADGGVYAGIPKEIGLRLIAHTMIVSAANNCWQAKKAHLYNFQGPNCAVFLFVDGIVHTIINCEYIYIKPLIFC